MLEWRAGDSGIDDPRPRPILLLAIAILYAVVLWAGEWFPATHINLFEYGHWLGPASDMLLGKVPYRQTFPVHGFLADGGLDFLLFRLTGPNFLLSIWLHQLIGVLFQPTIFLVTAAAVRRPLIALLAIPLNIGLAQGVVFDRGVVPLLSLAFFLWAIDSKPRRSYAIAAGVAGGLGLLYALEYGTYVLGAELIVVAAIAMTSRTRRLLRWRAYASGLLAVLLPFSAVMAVNGAFVAFLRVSFIDLPTQIGRVWGLPFPSPWMLVARWLDGRPYWTAAVGDIGPALGLRLYLAPLLMIAAIVVLAICGSRICRGGFAFRLLTVTIACAFLFRSVISRFHYEPGNALTGPLLVLMLCAIYESFLRGRRFEAPTLCLLGTVVAFVSGGPQRLAGEVRACLSPAAELSHEYVRLEIPRGGGAVVPISESRDLLALRRFVDRYAPHGPVLDLSNQPGLYFFLERQNPTRFYQVPLMEFFQTEIIEDLKATPPALVFLGSGTWLDAPDGRPNRERIPLVREYVRAHYPRQTLVGGTLVALPPEH